MEQKFWKADRIAREKELVVDKDHMPGKPYAYLPEEEPAAAPPASQRSFLDIKDYPALRPRLHGAYKNLDDNTYFTVPEVDDPGPPAVPFASGGPSLAGSSCSAGPSGPVDPGPAPKTEKRDKINTSKEAKEIDRRIKELMKEKKELLRKKNSDSDKFTKNRGKPVIISNVQLVPPRDQVTEKQNANAQVKEEWRTVTRKRSRENRER